MTDREARQQTENERLAALGHKRLPDGRCEHRWRNRTSRAVACPFLDGWTEGRAFGSYLPDDDCEAGGTPMTIDTDRLRALPTRIVVDQNGNPLAVVVATARHVALLASVVVVVTVAAPRPGAD